MSGLTKEKQFYVYIYKDLDKIAIYVGKGYGRRVRDHRCAKTRLGNKLRKIHKETGEWLLAEIIYTKDEQTALSLEKELITKFGRENLKTGTLYNLTDGGEAPNGMRHTEETKRRMSDMRKGEKNVRYGKKHTLEVRKTIGRFGIRNHNFGKNISEEIKRKISESHKGIKPSEETRKKLSQIKTGVSYYIPKVSCLFCRKSGALNIMRQFHLDKCIIRSGVRKKVSEETKRKMSEAAKGRKPKVPILTCTYCKLSAPSSVIGRLHQEKCKYKNIK